MGSISFRKRIIFNSPVILGFTGICIISLVLNFITRGASNNLIFSVYSSSITSIFTYIRLIGHIFGHVDWNHFFGNITLILIVGPLLEEKYGSLNITILILITALVTGIVNITFFPNIQLLGASGVAFALILLASFTSFRDGGIPLTFILVAIIYIGQQVYDGVFVSDNISSLTHIIGGVVGSISGYIMNKNRVNKDKIN